MPFLDLDGWLGVTTLALILSYAPAVLLMVNGLRRRTRAMWPLVTALDPLSPDEIAAFGRWAGAEAKGIASRQLAKEETARIISQERANRG